MKFIFLSSCFMSLVLLFFSPGQAKVEEDLITVFVPSVPGIEKLISERAPESKDKGQKSIWKNDDIPEADILMSLMKPQAYLASAMDMPQSFAMIFQADQALSSEEKPVRKDLLGDVEEIRYLDKKAWGANVALPEPGLYQFIMESKPFWDEKKNKYFQQSAKLYLPVLSNGSGWDKAVSQDLEIVPLTRPYGLQNPAFFSARLVKNGKAVEDTPVYAGRLNVNKKSSPSRWLEQMESRTDQAGIFSFVLNESGWWYCEATVQGEPLKGTDGEMKEVRKSAIIWLYVEKKS